MKIFHKEGFKRVVYVQVQDIMYILSKTNISIPASISEKTRLMIGLDDRVFFKFEKKEEFLFFKRLDFIVDYYLYDQLSEEEHLNVIKNLEIEINEIARKWNILRPNERISNKNLMEERKNKQYMLKVISEIYDIKRGNISVTFPELKRKGRRKK